MIKSFTIFVSIIIFIALALYFPQILQAMHGMSVLEMMQEAVGFVLHVVVVSILAYGAYAVVEIVHPLLKTFQQKQRHLRRSIRARRFPQHQPRSVRTASLPRTRRDSGVLWLLSELARNQRGQQTQKQLPRAPEERIRWE